MGALYGLLRDARWGSLYLLRRFALVKEYGMPPRAEPWRLVPPSHDDAGYMHAVRFDPAIEIQALQAIHLGSAHILPRRIEDESDPHFLVRVRRKKQIATDRDM